MSGAQKTILVVDDDQRLRETRLQLARSDTAPDLEWSLGVRRLQDGGDTGLVAGLYFGTRMMTGREPPMVYQFGFSAMLALVGGSLTSSEPGYAVLTRVVLTLAGAMAAVLLTALLEALFVPEVARRTSHGQTGQTLGQP